MAAASQTPTTVEVAEATGQPILVFGRTWMMDPGTAERAAGLGLTGRFGFWTSGRAGVLGDVDPSVAAAAIGFMAPDDVRGYWEARPTELSAWDAARQWFEAAAVWGRRTLIPMPEDRVAQLAALSRKVIDHADLSTGMLFAGSTLIPLPGDAAGDATINLNILRELRGGAHLSAVHAAGLGPHGSIMSTDDPVRGGASWAEGFGWTAPHPQPDIDARARAEEMTTAITAVSYECLDGAERTAFIDLVTEAHRHATS